MFFLIRTSDNMSINRCICWKEPAAAVAAMFNWAPSAYVCIQVKIVLQLSLSLSLNSPTNMTEFNSERSKPWNIYSGSDPSPSQTGTDRQAPWKNFGTSMNAISFGFVATAILISMFLIMAIFEHLFRPNASFSSHQDAANRHSDSRPMQKLAHPHMVRRLTVNKWLNNFMLENFPHICRWAIFLCVFMNISMNLIFNFFFKYPRGITFYSFSFPSSIPSSKLALLPLYSNVNWGWVTHLFDRCQRHICLISRYWCRGSATLPTLHNLPLSPVQGKVPIGHPMNIVSLCIGYNLYFYEYTIVVCISFK